AGFRIEGQKVGADLAHGSAVQLGDAHLEQDLLRAGHAEQVDDLRLRDEAGLDARGGLFRSRRGGRQRDAGLWRRRQPSGPRLSRLLGLNLAILTGRNRPQVSVDDFEDADHLARVARLAFDDDVVTHLTELDAGVGKQYLQLSAQRVQV